MKSIFQAFKVVTLALVLSFGLSYVYAWTAPTAPPPGGNIAAPVNTGSLTSLQSILGKIIVGMPTNSSMLALDVRGTNSAATTAAFQNIFQVASQDTTNPLALRFGIKTDATATNRYGSIEVRDGTVYQDLAIQPNGGNIGIGTIAPTAKLEIVGTLKSSGATTVGSLNAGSGTIETLGNLSGANVITPKITLSPYQDVLQTKLFFNKKMAIWCNQYTDASNTACVTSPWWETTNKTFDLPKRRVRTVMFVVTKIENNDWPAVGTQYIFGTSYPFNQETTVFSAYGNTLRLTVNVTSPSIPGTVNTEVYSANVRSEDFSASWGGVTFDIYYDYYAPTWQGKEIDVKF